MIAALSLVCGITPAKNGRDFAGFYQIRQKTDLGAAVRVEFAVRIQNVSDADVYGATAVLEGRTPPQRPSYWRSPSISLHDRESTVLEGSATLPKRELQQWDQGTPPHLTLEWTDQQGRAHRANVELHPGVIPEVK